MIVAPGVEVATIARREQFVLTEIPEVPSPLRKRATTRRTLLVGALAAAIAAKPFKARAGDGGNLDQRGVTIDPNDSLVDLDLRMLRRITYGLTETEAARMRQMGATAYLSEQLAYQNISDSACDAYVALNFPRVLLSYEALNPMPDDGLTQTMLRFMTVYRRITSKRQLFEKMVEFWSDHLCINATKPGGAYSVGYDRDVIRKYALGKFPEMLKACAKHPAMLLFLDQADSDKQAPNLNYARELLELHTLGVNGGYTQQDVLEVAKCFTGWTINWSQGDSDYLDFVFNQWRHSPGDKTVLGIRIPAGGVSEGEAVLDLLAMHPKTAANVARKLAKYLLTYNPSQEVIDDATTAYLITHGDIAAVIASILTPQNLLAAKAKHKRPCHYAASVIRATNTEVQNLDSLMWGFMLNTGHMPYQWTAPNGYPDTSSYWAGNVLPRWNFGLDYACGYAQGLPFDYTRLLNGTRGTRDIVNRINSVFFAGEMMPHDLKNLQELLDSKPLDMYQQQAAIGLALGSSSFQWY